MALEISPTWLAAFPGTRFFPDHRLLTWHPRGVLNLIQTEAMIRWMEAVEPELGNFNRFADLSGLTEVHLRSEEITALVKRRRGSYSGEPVTTVLLVGTPLVYGIAAMYERLMAGTPIHVQIVVRLTSACRILGVTPDVLIRGT